MSAATPGWFLTTSYWLHMTATIVWTGGLAALVLFITPAARQWSKKGEYFSFSDVLQNRLQLAGWFCLAVLALTGMVQLSSNPHYEGFLTINNPWAIAILIKHLVVVLMVVVNAYLSWGLLPNLQRLVLLKNNNVEVDETRFSKLEIQSLNFSKIQLGFSIVVLGLTALARTA